MKAKWLDRSITNLPFQYTLAASEQAYIEKMNFLKVPPDQRRPFNKHNRGAACMRYYDDDGDFVVIVVVPEVEDSSGIDYATRIVHEAVHIWRYARKVLGERKPSLEFEAYAVENITRNLLEEFARQKGWT